MYLTDINGIGNKTKVRIRYDCCGREHELFFIYAQKNLLKNGNKHICRSCWLKSENNPAKRKEVIQKIQDTNLERYGNKCSMNAQKFVNERKNFSEGKKEGIRQKRKRTCMERYGVEFVLQNKEIISKIKQTCMEKYGVDNPNKNEDVLEKRAKINLKKYGNKCSLHSPEIEDKTTQTMMKKYGVRKYNRLPEMREYLRENCRKWLKESWESGGPNNGKERSDEANEKQSQTMAKLVASGKFNPIISKNCGYFYSNKCDKKFFLRSGLEFLACEILESDENVEYYDIEPFVIKYKNINNKERNYVPDLIVKYKDDHALHLIEIKSFGLLKYKENPCKFEAAKNFAEEHGMLFEIWTEDELEANAKSTDHD